MDPMILVAGLLAAAAVGGIAYGGYSMFFGADRSAADRLSEMTGANEDDARVAKPRLSGLTQKAARLSGGDEVQITALRSSLMGS